MSHSFLGLCCCCCCWCLFISFLLDCFFFYYTISPLKTEIVENLRYLKKNVSLNVFHHDTDKDRRQAYHTIWRCRKDENLEKRNHIEEKLSWDGVERQCFGMFVRWMCDDGIVIMRDRRSDEWCWEWHVNLEDDDVCKEFMIVYCDRRISFYLAN